LLGGVELFDEVGGTLSNSVELKAEELKVLADKTRLRILVLLKERGELGLNDISNLTGKAKSTISDHLKLLLKAGFIERKEADRGFLYFLTEKGASVLPLIEDKPYTVRVEEEAASSSFMVNIELWLERIGRGRRHVVPSVLLGLSMIILGYMPLSAVVTSLALGAILGLLDANAREFAESSALYAVFTAISAILREWSLAMILTVLPSLAIFILIGGIAWIGVKLIMQKWIR